MMPPPKKANPVIRALGLKRLLFVNIVLFALVAWGFSGEYVRNQDMQSEVERLQAQADELAARNSLLAELGTRQEDVQVLEREARLKLNLRKPGEHVVVIDGAGDDEVKGTIRPADADGPEVAMSNPERWWHYFFQ